MKRLLTILAILLGAAAGSASCSSNDRVNLASVTSPEAGGPIFVDPNLEDGSSGDASAPLLECIGTECPPMFATCNSLERTTYKCGTDLSRDNENCGACGNVCREYTPVKMTSRCVAGTCELQCRKTYSGLDHTFQDWTDCNGLVEDGCEANLTSDIDNCGVCGNACDPGTPCIEGQCGCRNGWIFCKGKCVDPMSDDKNCNGCGNECEFPADACNPLEPNTTYGCVNGSCGKKKCTQEFFFTWVDCNDDVRQNTCDSRDGCEVRGLTSRENCGQCGVKCKGDEECVDEGNGYECAVPCVRAGKVLCGDTCIDVLNDADNCGTCGADCRSDIDDESRLKEVASCKQGVCIYECQPGYGDCNGDPADGCETDLRTHPQNCGACGVTCNVAAGQPCIEGKCLMAECDAGGTN